MFNSIIRPIWQSTFFPQKSHIASPPHPMHMVCEIQIKIQSLQFYLNIKGDRVAPHMVLHMYKCGTIPKSLMGPGVRVW
jgi:hypothetical protein